MAEVDDLSTDPEHFTKAVTELGEQDAVVTTEAIFNDKGTKVVEKGARINADMYSRLMQHKLSEPLENSLGSTDTVDGECLRATAETIIAEQPFFGRLAQDFAMRALLLEVISKVALPKPIAFQLTLCRKLRQESFIHAVQVALIAGWLAKTPTSLRFDVGQAVTAGLLHDLGMLHLDGVLLQPGLSLTASQRRQLYTHPVITSMLLKRHHEYSKEVLRAVEEHHECLNGAGYPRNLQGDAISHLGRILGLAEVVAAMFSADRVAPEMRLSVVLRMNVHRYDSLLVGRIMQQLRPDQEAASAMDLLLDDPMARLSDIEDAIAQWPSQLIKTPNLSTERLYGLTALATQTAQLHRTMATVGIAREQLQQIGDAANDDTVRVELSMLATEAAWQLRAMARQARRRWRVGPDGIYPELLQSWLDRVDTLVLEGATQQDEVEAA